MREVEVKGFGAVLVSVTSLNTKLVDINGIPISQEAEDIDDSIFFFLEDSEIVLSDEEIEKIILENI